MTHRRITLIYSFIVGCLFLISATIFFHVIKSPVSSDYWVGQRDKVTVYLNGRDSAEYAGLYWAQTQGLYQKYGLDVNLEADLPPSGWSTLMLHDDKATFILADTTEYLFEKNNFPHLKAVAALMQSSPVKLLLSFDKKEKNLEIGYYGSLKTAKKLMQSGYPTLTVRDYLVAGRTITGKTLDGIVTRQVADILAANRQGYSYEIINEELSRGYGGLIITDDWLMENYSDLTARFVKATVEGWQAVSSSPINALSVVKQYFARQYLKFEEEDQRAILEATLSLVRPVRGGKIGQMQYVTWLKFLAHWSPETMNTVEDLYTTSFIP